MALKDVIIKGFTLLICALNVFFLGTDSVYACDTYLDLGWQLSAHSITPQTVFSLQVKTEDRHKDHWLCLIANFE